MNRLIFDWNNDTQSAEKKRIELNDETLRDGLQATYVRHPSLKEKIALLGLMERVGIESANIGFPISGQEQKKDITGLIEYAQAKKFKIRLGCGARILIKDVEAIVDVVEKTGMIVEVGLFVGSSRIRYLVEKWDLRQMGKQVEQSISFAVKKGLPVMFVTEDTTRARPRTLSYLYQVAINSGATRICICDTVGHATPWSTEKLIHFIRSKIIGANKKIKIDWHGHNDKGLAIANCLAAAKAGVDRIQASALGVGERAGNACLVQVVVNLQNSGFLNKNLKYLEKYSRKAAKVLRVKIPPNYPFIGKDIFKTATGVHAAAIKKAWVLNKPSLAGMVYSAVDPVLLGKKPEILIGPMSGKANVEWTLEELNIKVNPDLIEALLDRAKTKRKILSKAEIIKVSKRFGQC